MTRKLRNILRPSVPGAKANASRLLNLARRALHFRSKYAWNVNGTDLVYMTYETRCMATGSIYNPYEPDIWPIFIRLLRPGLIFYDVGASSHGVYSLVAARRLGRRGRVVAFEAFPENVRMLRSNIKRNGLSDRIRVVPVAVTDRQGVTGFIQVMGTQGLHTIAQDIYLDRPTRRSMVPMTSLDTFVAKSKEPVPNVVKLDIEGAEVKALEGMQAMLGSHDITVLMEVHPNAIVALGNQPNQVLHIARQLNYQVYDPSGTILDSVPARSSCHLVLARNWPIALR